MNNELLEKLAKRIADNGRYKSDFSRIFSNIEDDIKAFLNSSVSEKNKELVLESLYLLQLYSDGYLSLDPRYKNRMIYTIKSKFLGVTNDEECEKYINELKDFVELLKKSEENPIETTKKILEDEKKWEGCKF